jgi:hypothetical protein
MNSVLHGCHLYCVDNFHANTYIRNIIKDETLPKYDRTNMCFVLINEKEESSKVSSIVSDNKLGYVDKLPFKPLPLKEKKKKKKKKRRRRRSKRREETVSYPKHVAPIIVFADESELDDDPMPVTYSSDRDWEKHTTFDIENLLGTNSEMMMLIIVVLLVLSMFLPIMICSQMNALWKIAILLLMMILYLQYMMIIMMNMIFSVHLLLRRKLIMITICLLYLMTMVIRIIMIAILLNLL